MERGGGENQVGGGGLQENIYNTGISFVIKIHLLAIMVITLVNYCTNMILHS
mgnify:CR=1 FL=1